MIEEYGNKSNIFQVVQTVCYFDETSKDYASIKLDLEIKASFWSAVI